MAENDQLNRLRGRLHREGVGPLTDISNQVTGSLLSAVDDLAQGMRQSVEDRPLISLLLAFEAGFAVARLGRRHARP